MTVGGTIKRLVAMDGAELRHRTSMGLRREASRLAYAVHKPTWHREALAREFGNGDPMAAHRRLLKHFATRAPRFVLDPSQRSSRVNAIQDAFPSATLDAVKRADRIVEGRFDLLGFRDLRWSSDASARVIDWHFDRVHRRRAPDMFWSRVPFLDPRYGDHKIIWELNRHQHWLALGRAYWLSDDERYRVTFIEELASWMAANPPLAGINWASMLELGLRSLSWIWALHFFASGPALSSAEGPALSSVEGPALSSVEGPALSSAEGPWTVDLLLGVDRQLTLVEQNLSRYFSPNTHLLGEALALYVGGRVLPELRRAERWERVGRAVLLQEIARQINGDGGHAELSTHYHRYTLDFYLLALAIARKTQDPVASAFALAVNALATFARAIADDEGRLPCIGDEDGGSLFPIRGREPSDISDSLQIAAVMVDQPGLSVGLPAEEVVWMTGQVPTASQPATVWRSSALPASGYFVSRSARNDHLLIDAGEHGFLNGGHAHADALSLTLSVRGRRLLIDPGTGCYTTDPDLRDRLRSSAHHNTLTVDGRSQSDPAGPFHWRSTARGNLVDWRSTDDYDYFEGTHDGYAPLVHHRSVLARPGCWFIVDRVSGTGWHRADLHWHLDPAWRANVVERHTVRAEHEDGTTVWLLSPADAQELLPAQCAPVYGPLVPTTTVRATREGALPLTLITVVIESPAREQPDIQPVPVTVNGSRDDNVVAFRLTTRDYTDTVLLAPERQLYQVDVFQTDARVLCWRETHRGESRPIVLIDGTTEGTFDVRYSRIRESRSSRTRSA
jgi:Heparinase II/III-like protein/Heparinase II/III N-terminus